MPNTLQIRRSATPSAVPSSLNFGELALNYADGKLFYKNAAGSIVELSGSGGSSPPSSGSASNAKLDSLTFNGSTTTFNLASGGTAITPANSNSLLIALNGVVQEPGAAYTVSGSQITFAVAPVSSDAFFGVHLAGGSGGVAEHATPALFPATGAASILYVATDTSRAYRWTGSEYVEVGPVASYVATTVGGYGRQLLFG